MAGHELRVVRRAFVDRLEREFAAFIGTRYAVACGSGTAALHLALWALGIGPGEEVLVPTLAVVASANPICYQGGTPVFVDSEEESLMGTSTQPSSSTNWTGGLGWAFGSPPPSRSAISSATRRTCSRSWIRPSGTASPSWRTRRRRWAPRTLSTGPPVSRAAASSCAREAGRMLPPGRNGHRLLGVSSGRRAGTPRSGSLPSHNRHDPGGCSNGDPHENPG